MPEEATMPGSLHSREAAGTDQKTADRPMVVEASHLAEVLVSFPRIEDSARRNHRTSTAWMRTETEMLLTIMLQLTRQIIRGRSRRIGTI